jgi:site-specific DNA-methyltransferase (adenine-specific)
VAADFGVTDRTIRAIASKTNNLRKVADELAATVAKIDSKQFPIYHGDFRELGATIADDSVDLIFCDPPYLTENIPIYGDLAQFAGRVLRPGGWCLAYCGQFCLPDILTAMQSHLTYGWCFSIQHAGGDTRFRKFKLFNSWKPIVGFFKPPLKVWWDWFSDCASGGREKDGHEWQQAQAEAEHFINHLSPIGGLVCDPFSGSGTTAAAAVATGRNWITFEIDRMAYESSLARLAKMRGDNDESQNRNDGGNLCCTSASSSLEDKRSSAWDSATAAVMKT